jgi:hypothetical protein
MGPHRFRRMKKALAGLGVNCLAGPEPTAYVLRLSKDWTPARTPCVSRHERVAMLAEA